MRLQLISYRPPDPFGTGDAKIAYQTMRALQAAGHTVEGLDAGGAMRVATGVVKIPMSIARGIPAQIAMAAPPGFARRVQDQLVSRPADAIVAVHIRALAHIPVEQRTRTVALLIDSYASNYASYRGQVPPILDLIYRVEARLMAAYEKRLALQCAAVGLVSLAEVEDLRRQAPGANVVHIPLGVDLDHFGGVEKREHSSLTFVFTGRLSYRPNSNAAAHLLKTIWPALRAQWPSARLIVAGASPSRALMSLAASQGAEVIADFADIRHVFSVASVALVPLQMGGGVQNKILEAMAARVPVVCSTTANRGIAATDGGQLLIADSPEEYVSRVMTLLDDPSRRQAIVAAAHDWVAKYHSPKLLSSKITSQCESIAEPTR